ncbi:zinc transporter ZIP1-like [Mercenaria mercenaria]|uniref:zinc transporter ZIP1-like n=1 Tax=Mercenaria mercenaria TaxID=6596 RepID=UPI00234E7890|nr:zinc transporter ZIP1-like [Mercenaria mercenaria]
MSKKGRFKMDVVVAKILSLVIVTSVSVIVGMLPCRLVKHFSRTMCKSKRMFDDIVSGVKCFSGGVFLGACFLHLIPQTRKKVDIVLDQLRPISQYPVAELLIMAGFFTVVFSEHVIRYLYYRLHEGTCSAYFDHDSYSFDEDYLPTTEDPDLNGCELLECKNLRSSIPQQGNNEENIQTNEQTHATEESMNNINPNNQNSTGLTHSNTQRDSRFDNKIERAPLQELEIETVVTGKSKCEEGKGQIHSVFLLTALSFYGVFEGMALGLQVHEGDVWVMCVAISIHQGIHSFGRSLQYARNFEKLSTIVFSVSAFSIICVVGMITGMTISSGVQLYTDVDVPNAILHSLSTGTIFYITFLNILYKQLDGNKDIKKVLCTFLGFSATAVILAFANQQDKLV